jgi:phosphate-selective porin OprO/OprP
MASLLAGSSAPATQPEVTASSTATEATESEVNPKRLEKEVRISIETNAPPATGSTTNAAAPQEKHFKWDFSWRGWDGLHMEFTEQTRLKNPRQLMGWRPGDTNVAPIVRLDRVKMSGTIGGRLEGDGAVFATSSGLTGFEDKGELRRARAFIAGDCILLTPFSYRVEFGYVPTKFTLEKAYVIFPDIPYIGNLQAGQFQPPMGLDRLTSSRDITFMEPAAALQAMAPRVEAGVQIGRPVFQERATWALGAFAPGAGGSEYGNASKNYGNAIGRLTWLAIDHVAPDQPSANQFLHLGLSANYQYVSSSTVEYKSRPESYIAPVVIDTGEIDASSATTLGLEAAWVNGPFSVQGEFIDSVVGQDSGTTLNFYGFYALASCYLTGESRPYDRRTGAFKRLIPLHDFNLSKGGSLGALQVAGRISYTDLTDGNISGGRLSLAMGEVNWYLQPHVRWMFNSGVGHVNGGPSDGNMFIFQTRVGIDF